MNQDRARPSLRELTGFPGGRLSGLGPPERAGDTTPLWV
jgi:hypothetical protein